jgi:hypothetical protein
MSTNKELLDKTIEWANDLGCIRSDAGDIENFFTVFPNETGKPCWSKQFDIDTKDWLKVYRASFEDSQYFAYEMFNGWYIGTPEEAGKTLATKVKTSHSRQENILAHMCYSLWCKDSESIKDSFKASMRDSEASIEGWLSAWEQLNIAIGKPHQLHFISLLYLPSGEDDEDNHHD